MQNFSKQFAKYLNGYGSHRLGDLDIVKLHDSWLEDFCDHDYVYKILFTHEAADVCTKCGFIKYQ